LGNKKNTLDQDLEAKLSESPQSKAKHSRQINLVLRKMLFETVNRKRPVATACSRSPSVSVQESRFSCVPQKVESVENSYARFERSNLQLGREGFKHM
jgi:hypothetical protein